MSPAIGRFPSSDALFEHWHRVFRRHPFLVLLAVRRYTVADVQQYRPRARYAEPQGPQKAMLLMLCPHLAERANELQHHDVRVRHAALKSVARSAFLALS